MDRSWGMHEEISEFPAEEKPLRLAPLKNSNKRQFTKDQLLDLLKITIEEIHLSCASTSSSPSVLTRENEAARDLCRVLDAIMCLGLISQSDIYWPAVSEFLPRDQAREVQECWQPKSPRAFSLAWVYHSLNNGTLEWQLLSLTHGRELLIKYYYKSAFVLDKEKLHRVCDYLQILDGQAFAFRSPHQQLKGVCPTAQMPKAVLAAQTNENDTPIARPSSHSIDCEVSVYDGGQQFTPSPRLFGARWAEYHPEKGLDVLEMPQATKSVSVVSKPRPKTKSLRTRARTGSDSMKFSRSLTDDGPRVSTPKESVVAATVEEEQMLREVLYGKRGSPDGSDCYSDSVENSPVITSVPQTTETKVEVSVQNVARPHQFEPQDNKRLFVPPPPPPNVSPVKQPTELPFEAQLKHLATTSQAKLDELSESLEWTQQNARRQTPDYQEGEVLLASGQIVQLALQVFENEGEQFYKMFRVFLGHHTGNAAMRWFLLTNQALYLLLKWSATKNEAENDYPPSAAEAACRYQKDRSVPLQQIDYISIGLNYQLFTVFLKDRQQFTLCTGSEFQTRSIMSSVELAVRRCKSIPIEPPGVYIDATMQRIVLEKWISHELKQSQDQCRPLAYSLVYWKMVAANNNQNRLSLFNKNAYVSVREFYPQAWFKRHTDWLSRYFILDGRKLYQFESSSCKVGQKILELRKDVVGCRQFDQTPTALELILPSDSFTIQMSFQTPHEAQQWLQAFTEGLSRAEEQSDECLPCCLTVTRDHVLLSQDTTTAGFIRTLAVISLSHVFSVTAACTDEQQALAMRIDSEHSDYADTIWWLSLRSRHELEKLVELLEKLGVSVVCATAEDLCASTDASRTFEMCHEMKDFWRNCKQI